MKLFALFLFALVLGTVPLAASTSEAQSFEVKVTGPGRPMLLIPGLACPGAVWDSTVAHFSNQYECHVFSIAGFGGTQPHHAEGPLLDRVRDDLATYIRAQKLSQPIVIGHSLGGFLALALAAHHPDLVGELVVMDGAPFVAGLVQPSATLEDARAVAADMRRRFDAMDDAVYQDSIRSGVGTRPMVASEEDHARIVAWSLASDRTTVAQAMTEMFSTDLREELSKIRTPALVLATWIAYQPFVDHERIEAAFRGQFTHLAGLQLSISDSARHFIMFDDPQWLFSEIEEFLTSANPSRSP